MHGSKLLYAFCEATVPRITFILRKAYGGAYDVMNSLHIGADFVFATPLAEIAVMGPRGAVEILYRDKISSSDNQELLIQKYIKEYTETFCHPRRAASYNFIQKIIKPSEIRTYAIRALEIAEKKDFPVIPKKHGNIPL